MQVVGCLSGKPIPARAGRPEKTRFAGEQLSSSDKITLDTFIQQLYNSGSDYAPLSQAQAEAQMAVLLNPGRTPDADRKARDRLIHGSLMSVLPVALQHLQPGTEVSDLMQESYVKLKEAIDSPAFPPHDGIQNFTAWVGRVVGNRFRDINKRKYFPLLQPTVVLQDHRTALPVDELVGKELAGLLAPIKARIQAMIDRMRPFDREILQRDARGESPDEIALGTGKNVGAISMGLTRARRRFTAAVKGILSTALKPYPGLVKAFDDGAKHVIRALMNLDNSDDGGEQPQLAG